MEFALIENPGNISDPLTNSGKVDYIFQIGKCQVTNAQYARFLNATASYLDPYGLYSVNMENGLFGGIKRSEKNGRYFYKPLAEYIDLPVVYVSWFDAARFCNWLHFGKPETGESVLGTTEGNFEVGAYNSAIFSAGRDVQKNVWEWVETLRNNKKHRWVRGGGATNFNHALSRMNVDSEYSDHELYIFGFRVARSCHL